ncbi:hypothetical protein ACP4OV_006657 [Aristida adscensionis]
MPSSASSSSSSSVQILDDMSYPRVADPAIPAREPDAAADGSDTDDDGGGSALSTPMAERFASSFRSQDALEALCKKHGVPKEFTPLPAGDRRACSPPPPGAACVYAHALEAGMRLPLHPFVCEVLAHFGVAPSQLAPNGWRIMVGFLALCRNAGAQTPSLAVFRHFFALCVCRFKGWHCFRGKDTAGALFTGLPSFITGWKEGFFFLRSPAPWQCPVLWGEPTKSSLAEPVLTAEEKTVAAKLLRERGPSPIDVRTYLSEGTIAAATAIPRPPPPPPPSPSSRRTAGSNGMDPSTYAMMQSMRAEKAAAAGMAVKSEPGAGGSDMPGSTPLSGKKRKLAEDKVKEEPAAHGTAPGACDPPGFSGDGGRKLQHAPDRHDGDTADWEVSRQLLQGIVTPSRERGFAAAPPGDVVASTYVAILQAANYATFSLEHARRLEGELEKAKAELAGAKEAAAAEVQSAKAAAVREFLGSKEHERRLVEEALKGYERGMEDMKRVAVKLCPGVDESRLFVPHGGFRPRLRHGNPRELQV